MIVILKRNDPADYSVIAKASLVVREQGKTYRVVKNRYGTRKVLRKDEVLDYSEKARKKLRIVAY